MEMMTKISIFIGLPLVALMGLCPAHAAAAKRNKKPKAEAQKQVAQPSTPLVLVTAFHPYNNAESVNASELVATEITEILSRSGAADLRIAICNLPIEWDSAFETLKACVNALGEKPALVIGLGESSSSCNPRLERLAYNQNGADPDNLGDVKPGKISSIGPRTIAIQPALEAAACKMQEPESAAPQINISDAIGKYLGNNISYQAMKYFKPKDIPFGFIHVGSAAACNLTADNNAQTHAATVLSFIFEALNALESSKTSAAHTSPAEQK